MVRNEVGHRGRIRRCLSLRWHDCDQAGYWRGFSYDKEWVEGASCWPLSLSIPIGEAEYSYRAIRPYFEGLLPEEYSRSVIARELGVSGHGYLKILAALGDECIGAVLVSNEGVKGDDESLSPYYMPLDEETFESLAATGILRFHLKLQRKAGFLLRDPNPKSDFTVTRLTVRGGCLGGPRRRIALSNRIAVALPGL